MKIGNQISFFFSTYFYVHGELKLTELKLPRDSIDKIGLFITDCITFYLKIIQIFLLITRCATIEQNESNLVEIQHNFRLKQAAQCFIYNVFDKFRQF